MHRWFLALSFLSFASPLLAQADTATKTTPESRAGALGQKVEANNEASGRGADWGHAIGVINAPTDRVMGVVTDYEKYEDFMPHFKQAKVLSKRGSSALVYMEASILKNAATLWAQLKISALPPRGTTQIVEAKMQKGNMDEFSARWELTPLEGGKRTLVDFRILVRPKLPLPNAIFSSENKKAAAKSIKALRKRTGASK